MSLYFGTQWYNGWPKTCYVGNLIVTHLLRKCSQVGSALLPYRRVAFIMEPGSIYHRAARVSCIYAALCAAFGTHTLHPPAWLGWATYDSYSQ